MKLILALCLAPAAALVAPVAPATASTKMSETKADLEALQNSIPGPPGYWDPLDLAGSTILAQYGVDTVEANIGWFRHAEIKHGRVAMAAFLGFIAGCTPLVSGEHAVAPYRGYVAGGTPFEQWDNMPLLAKAQIFTAIGMLESYGEGAGNPEGYVHYCNGFAPASFFCTYVDGVEASRRQRSPRPFSQAASPATSPRSPAAPVSARLASTSTTPSTGSTARTRGRTRPAGARLRSTTAAPPCSVSS